MRALVPALIGLGVVLSACEGVLGIPSDVTELTGDAGSNRFDGAADTGGICPVSQETDQCFKCTDEKCCTEYDACKADARCGQYYKECIPTCKLAGKTYDECVVQCDGTTGAGHAVFLPYFACGELHCLAECSNDKPDPCAQCLYASCHDTSDACARDRQCDTLRSCVGVCNAAMGPSYQSCVTACNQKASLQAQDELNRFSTCSLQFCAQICG
jgi:hypothetical protein